MPGLARTAAAAALCLASHAALAAPTSATRTLDFVVTNQSLFGPGGSPADFGDSATANLGFATASYSASASSGSISSSVQASITASFNSAVSFVEASMVSVGLSFNGASGRFSTALGARGRAGIDFNSIGGFNLPPLTLIDLPYQLDPLKTFSTGFGVGQAVTDSVRLVGSETPSAPVGITLVASAALNASQRSTLTLDALAGVLRATHADGEVREAAFSLGAAEALTLDLARPGTWTLALAGVSLENRFDSVFGLSATFGAGYGIGICGDLGVNGDTAFGTPFGTVDPCTADEEVTRTTPQLDLLPIDAFPLGYAPQGVSLGSITVAEIPLPAALPLLMGGLALLFGAGARRRRT